MFGFVTADWKSLSKQEQDRYTGVYCGICRRIREQCSNLSRLGLSYDMAFLALLLMSLYEPEEITGKRACMLHPIRPRPYVENDIINYCADMNVALAYYKALDDRHDDRKLSGKLLSNILGSSMDRICDTYPRQCRTIEDAIWNLGAMERAKEENPDETAACFGSLMGELFLYKEDRWSQDLWHMGMALGRFIYLADAAIDYRKDLKKNHYNPFIAMGSGENWEQWEEYLVLAMGRCTEYYERLPLVQDKGILDNILYGGIWLSYRQQQRGVKKQ